MNDDGGRVLYNRYRLVLGRHAKLGEGAQGQVRLATDLLTGRQVAVKICDPEGQNNDMDVENPAWEPGNLGQLGGNEEVDAKFWKEVAILRGLQHPNVIRLLDAFRDGPRVCMVLELAPMDVYAYIKDKDFVPEAEARPIFRQLIAGIKYCHARGVCHRDLKPENLLLTGDEDNFGTLKICDFGLAQAIRDVMGGAQQSNLHTICGSELYMAPEMLEVRAEGYAPRPTDVWSAALVMYNLVTGFGPWNRAVPSEHSFSVLQNSREEFWTWTRRYAQQQLSEPLTLMLGRMMDPNPATRATIEEVEASAWFNIGVAADNIPRHIEHIRMVEDNQADDFVDADGDLIYRDAGFVPSGPEAHRVEPVEVLPDPEEQARACRAVLSKRQAVNVLGRTAALAPDVLWARVTRVAADILGPGARVDSDGSEPYTLRGLTQATKDCPSSIDVSIRVIPAGCEAAFETQARADQHTVVIERHGKAGRDCFHWPRVRQEFKKAVQEAIEAAE